jgi:hypothetical protein
MRPRNRCPFLAAAGKVDAPTIMLTFRSRIGLAVRAGAAKPDIGAEEALKRKSATASRRAASISPR